MFTSLMGCNIHFWFCIFAKKIWLNVCFAGSISEDPAVFSERGIRGHSTTAGELQGKNINFSLEHVWELVGLCLHSKLAKHYISTLSVVNAFKEENVCELPSAYIPHHSQVANRLLIF